MTQILVAVLTSVAVATALVALALLVRARRQVRRLSAEQDTAARESARLAAEHQALVDETLHLASTRLPALATHLAHRHIPVPDMLHAAFNGTDVDQSHRKVLDHLAQAVIAERHRVDEAAQAVTRGATTVIQALSHQLREKIAEMQHRYDDPGLAQDLLGLDHLNEQNLRRVQGTGVLCGAWPGLTHADSHLGDVVVGAQSRIRGYQRVQVTSQLEAPVAVVARAVEPIAITVAELLANAVHHTHGTLAIDVSLHQAESGACVVIDDAGVGMHADEVEFATRLLSGQVPILLTELGDPPRAGLATIGRLVRQYGFSVSIDKASAYGGVRAIVFIPGNLLTLLNEHTNPMSAMAPIPRQVAAEPREMAPAAAEPAAGLEDNLPRRRRRQAQPAGNVSAAVVAPQQTSTPEETLSKWSALQAGTASGRAASLTDPPEGNH